jgi:hypothetical protein
MREETSALVIGVAEELEWIGRDRAAEVMDGAVVGEAWAYPVCDAERLHSVETSGRCLDLFENLQATGRAGLHCCDTHERTWRPAVAAEN